MSILSLDKLIDDATKLSWLNSGDIKPYVFVRPDNKIKNPGSRFRLDWFREEVIRKNPLKMSDVGFANLILELEHKAFEKSLMPMPRWVFYDCAIMPGYVAGFAMRQDKMTDKMKNQFFREQLKVFPSRY